MSIADMLLSLLMSKKAARNLKSFVSGSAQSGKTGTEREKTIKVMQTGGKNLMTPERAELIRHAMEIRSAKQTIFADLNDEQKQKLVAFALKKLLHEDPKSGKS